MFMKQNIKRVGAWVLAMAMLGACPAQAQELHVGDLIYVPAISAPDSVGTTKLRVQALMLGTDSDEPVTAESMAGAEFGVYVMSASGEMRPWANPLYPSEPMRIRTGEGGTSFTLPQGMAFYLRQESAPEGYVFDSETLIPVTGSEITVTNAMMGELVIRAQDSMGAAQAGVTIDVTGADGSSTQLVTDANGEAVIRAAGGDVLTVSETALTEEMYPAQAVRFDGQEQSIGGMQAQAQVTMREAARSRLTFVHPTPGSMQLSMQVLSIDENGEQVAKPLAGVRMTVAGETPLSVVTDETGKAEIPMLTGTYDIALAYEGELDIHMPIEHGQAMVENGKKTAIDLQARSVLGRIAVQLDCERKVSGGEVTLENESTGESFGPYAFDGDGLAVSGELTEGEYRISSLVIPAGTEIGGASCGEAQTDIPGMLALTVSGGTLTEANVKLLTLETQQFAIIKRGVGEDGEKAEIDVTGVEQYELLAPDGTSLGFLDADDSGVSVQALSGTYRLRMAEDRAAAIGVQTVSEPFALPTQEETITFAGVQGRLILTAVDDEGKALAGAQYAVTDASGARTTVTTDDSGMAVTALMPAGPATVETIAAPQDHDVAPVTVVQAEAGEAVAATIAHPSYGVVNMSIGLSSLDEQGGSAVAPMQGVGIRVFSVSGDEMTDTGIRAQSDESGMVSVALPAGEYMAQIDAQTLAAGVRAADGVRLNIENTVDIEHAFVCLDALGGVRAQIVGGELTDQQLAQVRFELIAADGAARRLTMQGGALYVGGLPAGVYVLRQTQIPEGYTLATERTLNVTGGEVTGVAVPLEEYAMVSVAKSGLTFTDDLRTYIVPLSGQYGVFVDADGEMKPYPSQEEQLTVWANVTPEEVAQGRSAQVKLPAAIDGSTYYLQEIGGAQGFGADREFTQIFVRAGEELRVERTVSSDRGFFTFDLTDTATGEAVVGAEFELADAASGETVLSFTTDGNTYRNEMAIPVGSYVLRQKAPAQGYALADVPQAEIVIEPYLSQGGYMTATAMRCIRIPQSEQIETMEAELYAAEQQGLTLLTFDADAMPAGETLSGAHTEIAVASKAGERVSIESVVLSGVTDGETGSYRARVEYCLEGGGWQPSDARTTDVITGPTAVSLSDVKDDVSAVRITYIDTETGLEATGSGFMPGQTAISVLASTAERAGMTAQAKFGGVMAYRTAFGAPLESMERTLMREIEFDMQGGGVFDTVSPGRDGRISGVAFFDEDADGVMTAQETGRYAGMTVVLLDRNGDVVQSMRTDAAGRYSFDALPSGTYTVKFDAGNALVYAYSDIYSDHITSRVTDSRMGTSAEIAIDGDHTDVIVSAGCIYAASVSGTIRESLGDGVVEGRAGVTVELFDTNGPADAEPMVVMTDDSGAFCFAGLMPGEYEAAVVLPGGYLCRQMDEGAVTTRFALEQGGEGTMGEIVIEAGASVSGHVRIDDDGDGIIAENAKAFEGAGVALLRAKDGHTEEIARTEAAADGSYAFDNLYAGEYSVLFELEDGWTFTRYGEDSDVYGAVSASGSTKAFSLRPGEVAQDIDAGATLAAQLTVTVFKDTQYDGQKGYYEEVFGGVSVSLIRQENGADAERISYTTDEQGTVVFTDIGPGEYVLAYQLPGQWRATKQVSGLETNYPVSVVPQSMASAGRSMPFTLSMGQSITMHIGAMLSGSISGTAYYDDNADAVFDAEESAVANVGVELMDRDGAVIATAQTLDDGTYTFEGLAPGRYTVRFTAQEGACFYGTARTVSRGGVQTSEGNVSSTGSITVEAGSEIDTADAGIVRLAKVTGAVWEDRNVNGVHDEGEPGLANVNVRLMNGTGRSIRTTAVTDDQGRYAFENLMPGTYMIRTDAPEGYVFSGTEAKSTLALDRVVEGRGYTAAFTLMGGAAAENASYFGVYTQGTVSGKVWNDENYDGLMGEDEGGLRGVLLTLTDAQGSTVTTQTGRSGEFEFGELLPGRYTLSAELTEGYVYTTAGDSIVPRADERTASIDLGELTMGQTMSGLNIGALQPASVGGIVWYDSDDDGRRKNSDSGVAGVAVTLSALTGADAGKTYSAVTDEKGAYEIAGVMPGDVQLTYTLADGMAFSRNASSGSRVSSVPMTDALTASGEAIALASGEDRSLVDVGVVGVGVIDGMLWIDEIYDGAFGGESGLAGAVITLTDAASGEAVSQTTTDERGAYSIGFVRMGSYTIDMSLPDGMIFTCAGEGVIGDVDAGTASTEAFDIAMGEGRTGVNAGAIVPAAISGRVVTDLNEDGVGAADEPGMPGVTVTAMQGGTVVSTLVTGEDGNFAFPMLRPGTYRVHYVLPDDALYAPGTALTLADADALEGETASIELAMGETAALDAVEAVHGAAVSGIAWLDADVDGLPGEGEGHLSGVTVELLGEGGQTAASYVTGGDGAYSFTRLRSGTYSLRFMLSGGMLLTDQCGDKGGSCAPVVPGNVGQSEPFALAMGETKGEMNIGGIEPGLIGDSVFLDANGNGMQDYNERLIPGVEIVLLHVNGDGTTQEAARVTSDEYGYYRFGSLRPGSYIVQHVPGEGEKLTVHLGEPLGEIDSDLDPETGMSDELMLRSGQTILNIDVGFAQYNKK